MKPSASWVTILVAWTALISSAGPIHACNVPVFRYALERWSVDPYELTVFHQGPLSDDLQAAFERLEGRMIADEFYVRAVDVDAELNELDQQLYDDAEPNAFPWLIVRYPQSYADDPPAYSGRFDQATVDALLESPARREIAKQILDGKSVVWLLIKCGDRDKDAAAEKMIREELAALEEELQLPELDMSDEQYLAAEGAPELRLALSLLTVPGDDPQEQMFLTLLQSWDPQLTDKSQPMAFAFFGRGRALGPLVGDQLQPEWLADACVYLTGPCSCQIKQQNPGFDMLMMVDWDGFIHGEFTLAEALPRLTTIAAVVQDTVVAQTALAALEPAPEVSPVTPVTNFAVSTSEPAAGNFLPATVMAIAFGLVVVVGISASMILRKSPT